MLVNLLLLVDFVHVTFIVVSFYDYALEYLFAVGFVFESAAIGNCSILGLRLVSVNMSAIWRWEFLMCRGDEQRWKWRLRQSKEKWAFGM